MKIWINTLNSEKLSAINEAEAKVGIKTLTKMTPTINGETFLPGEWRHLPDDFTIDPKLYPYIQEASVVLEEKVAEALKERGLDAFAQGLKEAAILYDEIEEMVAIDVEYYAEKVPVDCVAVLTADVAEKPIEDVIEEKS